MQRNLFLRKCTTKTLQALSGLAILFSPAAVLAAPPNDGNNWVQTFSEEFNGTTLNTNKWTPCYWWGTSNGCTNGGAGEVGWFQPDDVIVDNGTVHLRSQKRSMNGFDYTSGMVSSHDKYAFQYGYAEMRAKFPKGNGQWATFWLGSQKKIWPPEIDIAEYLGSDTKSMHMTLHYSTPTSPHLSTSSWWSGPDFSADYHTFGLKWEPNSLVWYIDGVEYKRYTDSANIPNHPMYLMATNALGKAWSNLPPDSTTPFPNYFDIDYIKVWRHKSSPSTQTLTPIISETEGLPIEAKSSADHSTFLDAKLSQGVGTSLKAQAANDFVTYTVNVPEGRTFNVKVGSKKATGRGIVQMSVNGVNYGSPQDLYSADAASAVELDMGNIKFNSPGHYSFKFTVTGKNPSSQGYKAVFDYIKLLPK